MCITTLCVSLSSLLWLHNQQILLSSSLFSAAVAQLNSGKEKMLWQSYQRKRDHVAFKANIFFVRCWLRPKTAEREWKLRFDPETQPQVTGNVVLHLPSVCKTKVFLHLVRNNFKLICCRWFFFLSPNKCNTLVSYHSCLQQIIYTFSNPFSVLQDWNWICR